MTADKISLIPDLAIFLPEDTVNSSRIIRSKSPDSIHSCARFHPFLTSAIVDREFLTIYTSLHELQ